jgi:Tfp pilus assembly protein PilV
MRRVSLYRRQDGDTIVEVLIATAIISLILATAYTITSRNTLNLQNNAERVQAQHLVEGQIEALRANDGLPSGSCFKPDNTAGTTVAECTRNNVEGSGASYVLKITGASNTYTVSATWTPLDAHAPANVTMYYRLKQ